MDWSLAISIFALLITAFTAAAKVADLTEDGRSRLLSWTRNAAVRSYTLFVWSFLLVALANGSLGVWLFSIAQDIPTRKDILSLVLFLINIAIGLGGINHMLNLKIKNK